MWYRLSDGPKATDSPSKQDKGKSSMMYSLQQKKNVIVGASTRTNTTSEITKICLCTGIWPAPRRNNQNIPMYSYLTCAQPIWGFFLNFSLIGFWAPTWGSVHVRVVGSGTSGWGGAAFVHVGCAALQLSGSNVQTFLVHVQKCNFLGTKFEVLDCSFCGTEGK